MTLPIASEAPAIARAILSALGPGADAPAALAFAEQAAADAAPAEAPGAERSAVVRNLADFWRFAETRPEGRPLLRIVSFEHEGEPLDRLEIVQDDAPFLVDSIMGEVTDQGLVVRAMHHPVVEVARDREGRRAAEGQARRESMIQVVLERLGPDRTAALLEGVEATLRDLRVAVEDHPRMLDLLGRTIAELERAPENGGESRQEELDFLAWLHAEHFVFLGARVYAYPRDGAGGYAAEEPLVQPESGLGVLRDPEARVLRRTNEPAVLDADMRRQLAFAPSVTVAKANIRSRVHRRVRMDYVGIRRYGEDGRPAGEVRLVGLFTAEAYDQPVAGVPLIRAKVRRVLARAGVVPGGHNHKRLKNIVENYPRDELFQMSEDELLGIALGVLHLFDRPRVRLFERLDPFDRFASLLLFVPRERYDSELRRKAGDLLAAAYRGRVSAFYPAFSDAPLARVHFIIGFTPGDHDEPDLAALEAQIADLARTWEDRFEASLRAHGQADALLARYGAAFPVGYKDRYDADEALADIATAEGLTADEPLRVRAFRTPEDSPRQFRFKLYRAGRPAPLADVLPILDNMGLKALTEAGFELSPRGEPALHVHEFDLDDPRGQHLVFAEVKDPFEDAFVAIWSGRTENDGFNRLVLELSISWREAALVRALARYRQQTGLDPSQPVQEQALAGNPGVTRLILDLFRTRFDPAIKAGLADRQAQSDAIMAEITEALQAVESLDDDRVLRRMAALVAQIQRTNFYQTGEDGTVPAYISFKVASDSLADLPAPKPYREIFVWAPHVEGVHLRFGPVARGGLRWSDRRDDFRTEVLGLAKAQQTKNAVIVPVGAKGGFFPKALPRAEGPEAVRNEAIRSYKDFLMGMLDLTDNLSAEGGVLHPDGVVIHDGDDPYLVVAADKGTATFSDIANGVAEDYGFWLGDAFASGGSAGYDHKAMGITARGAWEAVKRHFRELGKDIQAEPFTVVGVGDMSGDVFGNGMLLSRQIRLLAAFDHRHIFLDPDPDPETSWRERERLFALPRSSWDDYDRTQISPGGGVFPRSQKSIPLTDEVRALLGVTAEALNPSDLMSAILRARAELLYLGGIGTYVKARAESHAEVGDKANDALRVNARDLRVKVVGEGANLGLTQAGRIEFALGGGRINTDAIDNSAGVDSSDHEVNIKILTRGLERTGALDRPARDALLKSMTEDVAAHVLAHNYAQTLAISLLEADSAGELEPHARFMSALEAEGRLDRTVEGLPGPQEIAERREAGLGLTRPELAVLLAYGKLELFRRIVDSHAPDDPWFEQVLEAYFPEALRRWPEAIRGHRLRREIIATVLANDMVNRCGPSFFLRVGQATGCDACALVAAYAAARSALDLDELWTRIAALDGRAPAAGQIALFRAVAAAQRGLTYWLSGRAGREGVQVAGLVGRYREPLRRLRALMPGILTPVERERLEARAQALVEAGAPETLAREVAGLQPLTIGADLADLAEASSWPFENVARLYQATGQAFGFDRLRAAAGGFTAGDSFERMAVRRLVEDMLVEQAVVARAVMAFAGSAQAGEDAEHARDAVASWAALRRQSVEAARSALEEIERAGGGWSFAKLTIANAALRALAAEAEGRR